MAELETPARPKALYGVRTAGGGRSGAGGVGGGQSRDGRYPERPHVTRTPHAHGRDELRRRPRALLLGCPGAHPSRPAVAAGVGVGAVGGQRSEVGGQRSQVRGRRTASNIARVSLVIRSRRRRRPPFSHTFEESDVARDNLTEHGTLDADTLATRARRSGGRLP